MSQHTITPFDEILNMFPRQKQNIDLPRSTLGWPARGEGPLRTRAPPGHNLWYGAHTVARAVIHWAGSKEQLIAVNLRRYCCIAHNQVHGLSSRDYAELAAQATSKGMPAQLGIDVGFLSATIHKDGA